MRARNRKQNLTTGKLRLQSKEAGRGARSILMNKVLIASIFGAIFIVGLAVIISNQSISFGELFGSVKQLNPMFMGLLALPVIAVVYVLGTYLYKRNEERKWKKALLRTRARKQNHGDKGA